MANVDSHDLPLTTVSEYAAEQYRLGIDLLLSGWPGAELALNNALQADPSFALAHAAMARLCAIHARGKDARLSIDTALQLAELGGSSRERSHVAVIALAVTGQLQEALKVTQSHLTAWPRDRLILSLALGAFGLLAFSGMPNHDQARVDLCEKLLESYPADDWWLLTFYGWARVENGDVSCGRALLESAFVLRRNNVNAVHGLTHAMHESGAGEECVALINDWLPGYDRSGILHGHITWHHALVALEREDMATALELYNSTIRPAASQGMPINIVTDASSLLWRMHLYGHKVPAPCWAETSEYAHRVFPTGVHSNFVDPHMLLIEAITGDRKTLEERIEQLTANPTSAGAVVPAIGRAALAFVDGDYGSCASTLEACTTEVARIGGSRAQRDVIEDTLLVALMKSNQVVKAKTLLDARLHRRPSPRDTLWRAGL